MINTQVIGLDIQAFQFLMQKLEAEKVSRFFETFFPLKTTDRLSYEAIQDIAGKNIAAFTQVFGAESSELLYEEVIKLSGKIDPISIKRILGEEDLIRLQSNVPATQQVVKEKLYNNFEVTNRGVLSRNDFYAMQLLSNNGKIELTSDTNAGHVIKTIDYGLDAWQKKTAAILWSNKATAKPIDDIKAWVKARKDKGYASKYILMDDTVFSALSVCDSVVVETTYSAGNTAVKGNIVTLDAVNVVLKGARLPEIFIIEDDIQYIKADGTLDSTRRAWNSENIAIISGLEQGYTLNAPTAENSSPVIKKKSLVSVANGVTMQQYGNEDPVYDVTKAKGNMMAAWGRSAEILNAKVL